MMVTRKLTHRPGPCPDLPPHLFVPPLAATTAAAAKATEIGSDGVLAPPGDTDFQPPDTVGDAL